MIEGDKSGLAVPRLALKPCQHRGFGKLFKARPDRHGSSEPEPRQAAATSHDHLFSPQVTFRKFFATAFGMIRRVRR
jgi:hypothetical protein